MTKNEIEERLEIVYAGVKKAHVEASYLAVAIAQKFEGRGFGRGELTKAADFALEAAQSAEVAAARLVQVAETLGIELEIGGGE